MEYQAQTGFVKASELPSEVLPATPFVFFAYAFVWILLVGYVFALWQKLGRVERELSDVTSRLGSRRPS